MSASMVTFARGVARSNRRSLLSPDMDERSNALKFVLERYPIYVLCEAILSECLGWSDKQVEDYYLSATPTSFHPKNRIKTTRNRPKFILIDGKVIRR